MRFRRDIVVASSFEIRSCFPSGPKISFRRRIASALARTTSATFSRQNCACKNVPPCCIACCAR